MTLPGNKRIITLCLRDIFRNYYFLAEVRKLLKTSRNPVSNTSF